MDEWISGLLELWCWSIAVLERRVGVTREEENENEEEEQDDEEGQASAGSCLPKRIVSWRGGGLA